MVDTSGLSNIVRVDTHTKAALVEPNVPMDTLVEATLRHVWYPLLSWSFQELLWAADLLKLTSAPSLILPKRGKTSSSGMVRG
jgi:hypothetical protein